MSSDRLTLRAGTLELDLLPGLGGSIARFERCAGERQPLLREAGDAPASVLDASCFPLVPYVNRIRGGQFACDGRTITLAPNMPGDPNPLHGQGWLSAWQVVEQAEDRSVLTFRHEAGEWPWAYEARQTIALDAEGLSLTLACRNRSAAPMPCGLGFHPYFPCDAETVLDTSVEAAWTIDAAVLPVARVPATGRYDMRDRRICGQDLDNGFDGWGGVATIRWPGRAAHVRMSSPDAGRFQCYSPKAGGLFVAEPVQNANAALNGPQAEWAALGIAMLAEGEERALHARFDVIVA